LLIDSLRTPIVESTRLIEQDCVVPCRTLSFSCDWALKMDPAYLNMDMCKFEFDILEYRHAQGWIIAKIWKQSAVEGPWFFWRPSFKLMLYSVICRLY